MRASTKASLRWFLSWVAMAALLAAVTLWPVAAQAQPAKPVLIPAAAAQQCSPRERG